MSTYDSTRRPYRLGLERTLPLMRRDGVFRLRTVEGEHPMMEGTSYFIGPYDTLWWIECLFWGAPQGDYEPIPLSLKFACDDELQSQGFIRLIDNEGIASLAARRVLSRLVSQGTPIVGVPACTDPECAGGGPPCIDHVEL